MPPSKSQHGNRPTGSEPPKRRLLNGKPVITVFACLVVIGICIYSLLPSPDGTPPPAALGHTWFYDLSTRKLFMVNGQAEPPIMPPSMTKSPDGTPMGVRAHVFSCSNCADESSRFTGYLETFVHAAIPAATPPSTAPDKDALPGTGESSDSPPASGESSASDPLVAPPAPEAASPTPLTKGDRYLALPVESRTEPIVWIPDADDSASEILNGPKASCEPAASPLECQPSKDDK